VKRPLDGAGPVSGVDRVRGQRPEDDDWRADALVASGHSRLVDELRTPADDPDPRRAQDLCARVCRTLLGDLAPCLLPLSKNERLRVQALVAHTRTLFDFALQRGMHGERLAQINRWEFDLERALDGDPPAQPVFVAMAIAETVYPWPREALGVISSAARRTAVTGTPSGVDSALPEALFEAAAGHPASADVVALGRRLLALLLIRTTATPGTSSDETPPQACGNMRPRLDFSAAPRRWRRSLTYLAFAMDDIAHRRSGWRDGLGIAARLRLLARAYLARQ